MENETYYLSSLESTAFQEPRACRFIRSLRFSNGKQAALVEVSPSVYGLPFDRVEDISQLIVTARHEGDSLFPVRRFPCFVFVAVLEEESEGTDDVIAKNGLRILSWGELYKTKHDAVNKIFD